MNGPKTFYAPASRIMPCLLFQFFHRNIRHYLKMITLVLRIFGMLFAQLALVQAATNNVIANNRDFLTKITAEKGVSTLVPVFSVPQNQKVSAYRSTAYPSSNQADSAVLTWSGDPCTTQAVQWRTQTNSIRNYLVYTRKQGTSTPNPETLNKIIPQSKLLVDKKLINDPIVSWHTVELTGLTPGATYLYALGNGSPNGWTDFREFTTSQNNPESFSFVYMGDAQKSGTNWTKLVQNSIQQHPKVSFYIMTGDLVNRGNERNEWDSLFLQAKGVFDQKPLVPVIGNHECQNGHPTLYLEQFALPRNGPNGMEPERAYAFEYGNALFIVLDSTKNSISQVKWLEEQLSKTKAKWKFVACHHPAYSSALGRNNAIIQRWWCPLFDKYQVDVVLQGHDHAYLRTYPLKKHAIVGRASKGTTYIISVSGPKMYKQFANKRTAVGITNVSTYQVLEVQNKGNRLLYHAFDSEGKQRDRFVIEK